MKLYMHRITGAHLTGEEYFISGRRDGEAFAPSFNGRFFSTAKLANLAILQKYDLIAVYPESEVHVGLVLMFVYDVERRKGTRRVPKKHLKLKKTAEAVVSKSYWGYTAKKGKHVL